MISQSLSACVGLTKSEQPRFFPTIVFGFYWSINFQKKKLKLKHLNYIATLFYPEDIFFIK